MLPSGAMGVPGSSKVAGSCLGAIRQAWIDPKKRVSKRVFVAVLSTLKIQQHASDLRLVSMAQI